jgi:putative endonuclease
MWHILERFRRTLSNGAQPSPHRLGLSGERLAVEFLQKQGYRVVATNFLAPIGYSRNGRQITGEIDIIAYDESSIPFNLAFIEVKTRSSREIAAPESAVDIRKQRQIIRTSNVYRRLMSVEDEPYRYDVVSVLLELDRDAELKLLRNYFTDRRFERSSWIRLKI